MAGEEQFQAEGDGAGDQQPDLAGQQGAAEQAAIDVAWRHHVGQRGEREDEAAGRGNRQHRQPGPPVANAGLAARVDGRQRLAFPQRRVADGADEQAVEPFDNAEMRAQPATVNPAPAPGGVDEGGDGDDQRQDQPQHDVDHGLGRRDAFGQQVVDAQLPGKGQDIGVLLEHVVAEQVEDRRQHEEGKEAELRHPPPGLLGGGCHSFSAIILPFQRKGAKEKTEGHRGRKNCVAQAAR